MSPEHIDALEYHEQLQRALDAAVRLLRDARNGDAWDEQSGAPIYVDEAAEQVIACWEALT